MRSRAIAGPAVPPIITAEGDVLRNDAEAYGVALQASGVPLVATRYLTATSPLHDDGTRDPTSRAAILQTVAFLMDVLAD